MDCNPSHWLPDSPFRAPEWRWLRARYLHERGGRPDPRIDDEWVQHARRLLADDGRDAPDHAIRAAFDLWRGGQPLGRYRLEAFLLTQEPLERVAGFCGLPVEVVTTFHQVFFDVRPWLAATDWVLLLAVGCGPWNNFAGGDTGTLWRYVAYMAGPRALEVVMAVTTDQSLPGWARSSCHDDLGYGERRLRLLGKLTLGALTAQSDDELKGLVEARDRLRRVDRQAAGTRDRRTGLLPAMEDFLGSIGGRRKSASKAAAERPKSSGRTSGIGGAVKARRRVSVASLLAGLT